MLLIIKVSGFARGFNTRLTRQHIGIGLRTAVPLTNGSVKLPQRLFSKLLKDKALQLQMRLTHSTIGEYRVPLPEPQVSI